MIACVFAVVPVVAVVQRTAVTTDHRGVWGFVMGGSGLWVARMRGSGRSGSTPIFSEK